MRRLRSAPSNVESPPSTRSCMATVVQPRAWSAHLHCTANEALATMNGGTLRIGVVGVGYWGPNLARNFAAIEGSELAWSCDSSPEALERMASQFPGARPTAELEDLLADDTLDAIVLATPVATHAELTVKVLRAG